MERQFFYERCREVEADPNGYIDLWSREHGKSSIITFAKTIQDILIDPEITVGIFSHTRPIAKGFLRQIKREFEGNENLKFWFDDILYVNPGKESPKWSEDDGIIVKRKGNPKESTVEAWGLVDGQPTSKHFRLAVYDDVVTKESVTSPDMMRKTTDALELSYSLGTEGGVRRFIGTRYHFGDSYATLIARGTATLRLYDGTVDNCGDITRPVLWSPELMAEKRRDYGPYTFACFAPGTQILMADWAQRPIESLRVGDEVIGYKFGVQGERATLTKSKVLATQDRIAKTVLFTFESGRTLACTPDHKFWHGRAKRGYSRLVLGLGRSLGGINAACSIYDPRKVFTDYPIRAAGYIAGMFDGEGSVSSGTAHISQSETVNPQVCSRISQALGDCGIPFNICLPKSRGTQRDYFITGGRQGLMRFLHCVGDAAKRNRLAEAMLINGTRNIGKGARDRLISIDDLGNQRVFNIQTETGNYIAGGYAAKNCQILQNPKADDTQGFDPSWIQVYAHEMGRGQDMNIYMTVDAASEKKKDSDYTVIWVWGLNGDQNYYILDMIRDRLNLTERAKAVMAMHRRWHPVRTGYEKYGMMADIEYLKIVQEEQNYRFPILELGGSMPKRDRIRRLVPIMEQGRVYAPKVMFRVNYQGERVDLMRSFIDDELTSFPYSGAHDDMLDAASRIFDMEPEWPDGRGEEEDEWVETWSEKGRSAVGGY